MVTQKRWTNFTSLSREYKLCKNFDCNNIISNFTIRKAGKLNSIKTYVTECVVVVNSA